ncbi:MAG TPA: RsmB/NOP family class I SAM-dependent RNA methyltransferase, partial [Paracoccaceae bacterium]|nr:RsmB/NOP family class I SAM-dependent RNA methyltransferase [Paracoccaceae bacterium]
MTPGARAAAAIDVLDRWLAGTPVEQALTNWARASRFAGSGDRRAVRDLVFDAVRCRRSFAAWGGAETGRGLVLGGLRAAGRDPGGPFSGQGHAPPPLTAAEAAAGAVPQGNAARDIPDWLEPPLRAALGAEFEAVTARLRSRAPVFLRVNAARATRDAAQARLIAEGVATLPHPLAKTALEVTENAERIGQTACFSEGLFELQDAASQAVIQALPLAQGMRALDLCAGGGGKALAMAAAGACVWAHDAAPA